MSIRISVHCDRTWREGACPSQLLTDAATTDDARRAAGLQGWHCRPEGPDHCPACSGAPAPRDTAVLYLDPDPGGHP